MKTYFLFDFDRMINIDHYIIGRRICTLGIHRSRTDTQDVIVDRDF